jgi:hypothetical protein
MSINKHIEEIDADLGYIIQYATALHNFVGVNNQILTQESQTKVKLALANIREAFLKSNNNKSVI